MTHIRPARSEDAGAIAAIWNPLIRDTLVTFTTLERSETDIRDLLVATPCFVAETDGRIIGFARYGPFRDGPGYRFVAEHTVYLVPDARGRGAGRALMTALEEAARADQMRALIGAVSSANPQAEAFHLALGYRKVATVREVGYKFDQWLDLLLYQKQL